MLQRIIDRAHALGFDAIGVARADEPLLTDHARYQAFVDAGFHGQMAYLATHRDVRRSLLGSAILDGARSVICVADRYATREPRTVDNRAAVVRLIARYARGFDYHDHLRRRLRSLADCVRQTFPGTQARPLCDTAPVLERAWAARSGLGFIGKNGMVIVPKLGSYVLLGEVVTTASLPSHAPLRPRCGDCTRCLDACPTRAFPAPFVLDARRCISYLTIEHRGPFPPDLAPSVGRRLFGCDVCQQVCPFNRAQQATIVRPSAYSPLPQWQRLSLQDLYDVAPDKLRSLCKRSPLHRLHFDDWKRNIVGALAASE